MGQWDRLRQAVDDLSLVSVLARRNLFTVVEFCFSEKTHTKNNLTHSCPQEQKNRTRFINFDRRRSSSSRYICTSFKTRCVRWSSMSALLDISPTLSPSPVPKHRYITYLLPLPQFSGSSSGGGIEDFIKDSMCIWSWIGISNSHWHCFWNVQLAGCRSAGLLGICLDLAERYLLSAEISRQRRRGNRGDGFGIEQKLFNWMDVLLRVGVLSRLLHRDLLLLLLVNLIPCMPACLPASVSCSGNAPLGMSLSYRCSLLSAVKRLLLRGLGKSLNAIIRGTGVAHLRVNGFLRVGRSDTVLDHHHRHFLDSLNILYSSSLAIINEDWPSFRL